MRKRSNLRSQRFGRLVVLSYAGKDKRGHLLWNVICDCGQTKILRGTDLMNGGTQSCGCLKIEIMDGYNNPAFKHGHATAAKRSPEYMSWQAMSKRCFNPKSKNFKYYGGRGITICPRWKSFEKFLSDMGDRPPGKSIDRIEPDGNYEPKNCRWATRKEQILNRRKRKEGSKCSSI